MVIHVRDGEPLFKAIKRFKRMVEASGIKIDLRQHRHYLKPSERRRRKRRQAERQRRREARERKET